MNESFYKYMKLGLGHFSAYPSTMEGDGHIIETVRNILTDSFFNSIEVSWIKDDTVRNKVKKMLEQGYVAITYGAQPRLLTNRLNINSLNEMERIKAINTLMEGLDEAHFLGARDMVFLSGGYEENKKGQAYDALVKSTKELCKYAKLKGMNVILEVSNSYGYIKPLIGTTYFAKIFAEEILEQYDNFGLMIDLSCMPQGYDAILEAILPIKYYIMHVRIGNEVGKDAAMHVCGDQHSRFNFKRDVEQLIHFLRALIEIKFLNAENPPIVNFVINSFNDEDPELIIAKLKRVLQVAWTRL